MSICLYDNPATMRREAWQDGALLCDISATLLESKGFNGWPGFPFILNAGAWETGKFHHGDASAMSSAEQKAGRESE